jgi:hypothetical protein
MRVLVVGAIAPEGLAYLRERNIQVTELAKPTLETLYARIGDYHGQITRSGTAVTGELLATWSRPPSTPSACCWRSSAVIPDAHARLKALEWDRSFYGAHRLREERWTGNNRW